MGVGIKEGAARRVTPLKNIRWEYAKNKDMPKCFHTYPKEQPKRERGGVGRKNWVFRPLPKRFVWGEGEGIDRTTKHVSLQSEIVFQGTEDRA